MGDVAKGIKSFKKGMKDPTQDQTESTSTDKTESVSSEDKSSKDSNSAKK